MTRIGEGGAFLTARQRRAMGIRCGRATFLLVAILGIAACGGDHHARQDYAPAWERQLMQLSDSIADSSGYSRGSVDALLSQRRLYILVDDERLAHADHNLQLSTARQLVRGIQPAIDSDEMFKQIVQIDVAVLHRESAGGLLGSSHTEEVFTFERGEKGQFIWDVL
ncbi:MAG: hypothetical protein JSS29_01505 [Proteobacteria bacterium]|nr:hypothetical protein [Pseudomonadota bacterium]